jgi:multiple sugar transport system ATP-binding protein
VARIGFEGVTKRFGDTVAVKNMTLDVADGEFMILVGPSGCGKTTALRMVAGFEQPTEGEIVLGERTVNDVDPSDRDVAMVFQNYALFPHMKVFDNIAFPLRMRGVAKPELRERVAETTRLLGLGALVDRMPHELSGGQRQRVAMGRAIVRHPQAFLMDEPLSNLDAKLRTEMRAELAKLHRRLGATVLYVTHDQTEAMTLGSRVAVLRDGVLQQVASPRTLYEQPANAFVGKFIGTPPMNLLRGVIEDGRLRARGVETELAAAPSWPAESRPILVGVRPEAWRLSDLGPSSGTLQLNGEVEVVEDLGSETIVYFSHGGEAWEGEAITEGEVLGTFAARVPGAPSLRPGSRVGWSVDLEQLYLFDGDTGVALAPPESATGSLGDVRVREEAVSTPRLD